ncbi:GNAT family N-acetyltransferase [Rufibacter sediminis]|uniref:GNAT family N-acetyltransferase n=1 Tax=Rufibacter sediminis TaxID=2762756 RepID=UPI0021086136|nr:GNAT family N-acetyltransferase [Rufibacter sediminis]
MYVKAFPPEERRSIMQQEALLTNKVYQFLSIRKDESLAGILGVWQFPAFTFLEHFAISPDKREKGLGREVIAMLQEISNPPLVLEVEFPHTPEATRRIAFYERAGFHLNSFAYSQPPYASGKPWVPLHLMSWPERLEARQFEEIKGRLYAKVYQVETT